MKPSIWRADEQILMSFKQQRNKLLEFFAFYKKCADEKTYIHSSLLAKKEDDNHIEKYLQNFYEKNIGDCVGLSYGLVDKLHQLGLPAKVVWISKDDRREEKRREEKRGTSGHSFVVYKYLDNNYVADLTSVISGVEARNRTSLIWKTPFDKHVAKYCHIGRAYIDYKNNCDFRPIEHFAEFEAIKKELENTNWMSGLGLPFLRFADIKKAQLERANNENRNIPKPIQFQKNC